tara:strand:- start:197 stop:661 length:465 start_codon:yes stop_codon:yes gene_type:complete
MNAKTKQSKASKPIDENLEYLKRIGMTEAKAADLMAPDVGALQHQAANPFKWVGNIHPNFEYYRATDDNSIHSAKGEGYFQLPKGAGVRMQGCSTENEVIMARTKEVGDAHRAAERRRVEEEKTGRFSKQTPLSHGININESVARTQIEAPVGE